LKLENEELKKINEDLKKKLDDLEIIKAENSVLKEIANLSSEYAEFETIGAYIINKNISNLSDTFVINIGIDNGVETNMVVMGENGLVGHVISSNKNTAKVAPIIDMSSSVSGELTSSGKNVIVRGGLGSNKNLRVDIVDANTDFVIGDTIETSGLGGIYPKGIIKMVRKWQMYF
jgi:rod shape-determining protein MreC